jgi:catechol 2,3-dioxygenase-like lactoylglutathione lyase family enzyme
MLQGLRTAIYSAPDLARAKAWYRELLGVEAFFDQPFHVGFAVGGFELGLLPDGVPGSDGPQPYWGVANADSAWQRLLAQPQLGVASPPTMRER